MYVKDIFIFNQLNIQLKVYPSIKDKNIVIFVPL